MSAKTVFCVPHSFCTLRHILTSLRHSCGHYPTSRGPMVPLYEMRCFCKCLSFPAAEKLSEQGVVCALRFFSLGNTAISPSSRLPQHHLEADTLIILYPPTWYTVRDTLLAAIEQNRHQCHDCCTGKKVRVHLPKRVALSRARGVRCCCQVTCRSPPVGVA